jgi:hypothetical protein
MLTDDAGRDGPFKRDRRAAFGAAIDTHLVVDFVEGLVVAVVVAALLTFAPLAL